jgi:hypothetical protein
MKSRRENYLYSESGLPFVTLSGILVKRCSACGNYEVSIPRIEELHRLIARSLIVKRTRFKGAENKIAKETKLRARIVDDEWTVVAA